MCSHGLRELVDNKSQNSSTGMLQVVSRTANLLLCLIKQDTPEGKVTINLLIHKGYFWFQILTECVLFLGSVFYYYYYKRTCLKLGDPRFYEESEWLRREFARVHWRISDLWMAVYIECWTLSLVVEWCDDLLGKEMVL